MCTPALLLRRLTLVQGTRILVGIELFRIVQVKLANELQKPLFLHCRDAAERFAAILREQKLSVPAVAHCFTGSREELAQYIQMGLHIGITGWVSTRLLFASVK